MYICLLIFFQRDYLVLFSPGYYLNTASYAKVSCHSEKGYLLDLYTLNTNFVEMYLVPFILLNFNGAWRPNSWNSPFLKWLYKFYVFILSIIYYSFMLFEILDIVLVAENVQQVVENMIQLLNVVNVAWKNLSFQTNRKKLKDFINLFLDDLTSPRNPVEEAIQKRFDREARRNVRILFMTYTVSVCTYAYMPFFISDVKDRVLVYREWLPYTLENVNHYYLTYLHQSVAVTIAAFGNAATETLVSGFMIQVCAQFAILEERFRQLPHTLNKMRDNRESPSDILSMEKKTMSELIKHHLRIFKMTEILNEIYVFVILIQFITSIFVLCVCTYTLAFMKTITSDFLSILLYLFCMFMQIFLYTWYGNEVTLRSVDLGSNILLCDWAALSTRGIKDMLIIYERTKKPIILSSGYIITLSNLAFTSIVKTSYSVFNVLSV